MSHGFREYFPLISSKTIKFAPSMWVRYDSVVTPLFCRQRLYRQQMNSTLTDNRQNGQKQIGQIHLFNLLLPIDFILVDNIGQRIPPVAPDRTQGQVNERQTQEACYTICNRKVALATERFAGTHSCATSGTLWPLPSNNQSEPLALNLSPYPCCGIVLSSNFIQHTSKTSPFHQNETNILHFPAVLLAYMKNKSYFCRKNNNMTVCQKLVDFTE